MRPKWENLYEELMKNRRDMAYISEMGFPEELKVLVLAELAKREKHIKCRMHDYVSCL